MTMKFSALTKDELLAIIMCCDGLLEGTKENYQFLKNPTESQEASFKEMIGHLQTGFDKLVKIFENEAPIKPNNN